MQKESDLGSKSENLETEGDHARSPDGNTKSTNAIDIAKLVFSFVSGAREFVEGMDQGDEVKLLRLRTRKNEIVIVPGMRSLTSLGNEYSGKREC